MTVKLDLDVFQTRLNELKGMADDFGLAQASLEGVLEDSWTSVSELNQFESPEMGVRSDLAVAFNSIRESFVNLATDLRTTFENFVEADSVSAERFKAISGELTELEISASEVPQIPVPVRPIPSRFTVTPI